MNWIDFSKEKPKEEPHRPLLVRLPDNTYERVNSINYDRFGRITHWAEIEPPNNSWNRVAGLRVVDARTNAGEQFLSGSIPERHLWAYRHILTHDCGSISCGTTVYQLIYKPDESESPPVPFEKWKVRYFHSEELTEEKEVAAKAGWDAAIRWKEGQK